MHNSDLDTRFSLHREYRRYNKDIRYKYILVIYLIITKKCYSNKIIRGQILYYLR